MAHSRPLPPYAKKGSPIEAAHFNAIIELLRSLDISGGPGISVKKSSNGTTISAKPGAGTPGARVAVAVGELGALDVELGEGADASHVSATMIPGTINGFLITGYATPTELAIATTYYATLTITATDGEVTGAALTYETTAPGALPVLLGEPPTTFTFLIGIVTGGEWVRIVGPGSLSAVGTEVFRVSKTAPDPGTLPYDIYFSWLLSSV